MRCIGPRAKDADLWILISEDFHRVHQEGVWVEVEHVKAHRSNQEMQEMSLFQKFITEGHEKADELAQEGAWLDGGDMAQVRAITIQHERDEVCAALQYADSFHCLVEEGKDCEELRPKPKEKLVFGNKRGEAKKHRTEWCVAANAYRCMRCGRSSNNMNSTRNM